MGGWLSLIIEVKTENLKEVLDLLPCPIATTHISDEYSTILCNIEYFGYGEPTELYEKVKDYVKDIHCIDVGTAISVYGRDNIVRAWSCKKEYKQRFK